MWNAETGEPVWTSRLDGQIFTAAQTVEEHPVSIAFSTKYNRVAVASTAGVVTFLSVDDGSVVEFGYQKWVQKIVAWAKPPQE